MSGVPGGAGMEARNLWVLASRLATSNVKDNLMSCKVALQAWPA